MSKPKPGFGKGIVKTLSHSHSSSIGYTSGVSYSTSSASTSAQHVAASVGHVVPTYTGANGRRDFGSIGIPNGSSSSGNGSMGGHHRGYSTFFPSSSNASINSSSAVSGGPGLEEKDIVTPFRPPHRRPSTPPAPSPKSLGKRPLTTLSSSPSALFPPSSPDLGTNLLSSLSFSLPSLPSFASIPSLPLWSTILDKQPSGNHNSPWSTFSANHFPQLGPETLEIVLSPPSPPPNLRHKPNILHSALSPTNAQADPITTLSNGFAYLGVPQSIYTPVDITSAPDDNVINQTAVTSSQLIFHLGASGSPKERPQYTPRNRSSSSSPPPPPRPRSFPLPDVTPPSAHEMRSVGVGEDAYFARLDGMCIADGVGGWARSGRGGADAGRWSRLLTHFCEVELGMWGEAKGYYAPTAGAEAEGWSKKAWDEAKSGSGENQPDKRRPLDPVEIMQRGYEKCLSCFTAEGIHGSSTCLLALLYESTLSIANLGDCCLLLIRGEEIIFRTDEMQHAFNFPLQLGTHSRDEPMKDAKRYDVGVGKGDVVVLGSDGLMDNLFDEDILETLAQFSAPQNGSAPSSTSSTSDQDLIPFSPQKVSEALCKRARAISEQTSATTPFMVRAIEEGIDFVGGKKDDISVVVGVIGDRESGDQDGLALHTR